jgi:hypothetical protein
MKDGRGRRRHTHTHTHTGKGWVKEKQEEVWGVALTRRLEGREGSESSVAAGMEEEGRWEE